MQRFSIPFRTRSLSKTTRGENEHRPRKLRRPQSLRPAGKCPPSVQPTILTPGVPKDQDDQMQACVQAIREDLHGHFTHERIDVEQVTEIKRALKRVHRDLELFQMGKSKYFEEDTEGLVRDATRMLWQSYRCMVTLEERWKGAATDGKESTPSIEEWDSEEEESSTAAEDTIRHSSVGVYVPTGARNIDTRQATKPLRGPQHSLDSLSEHDREGEINGDVFLMARPLTSIAKGPTRSKRLLRSLSQLVRRSHSSLTTLRGLQDNPLVPRATVKRRVQAEESNPQPRLNLPDTIRRGSSSGGTITSMCLHGVSDARYYIPTFAHLKHHEVRSLQSWMSDHGHLSRTGSIGRTEKLLHGIQLLQSGWRYESLAVMFSRTPRQIQTSVHEVMCGLLELADSTSKGDAMAERMVQMYMPLWGLWSKYDGDEGQTAEKYFGFGRGAVEKVLGAMSLYIGRWRMQGGFAVDGPVWSWGGVFVLERLSKGPDLVKIEEDAREGEVDGEEISDEASEESVHGEGSVHVQDCSLEDGDEPFNVSEKEIDMMIVGPGQLTGRCGG